MSVCSCSQRQRSRLLLVSLTTLFNKCTQQSQQDPKCGAEKERETEKSLKCVLPTLVLYCTLMQLSIVPP